MNLTYTVKRSQIVGDDLHLDVEWALVPGPGEEGERQVVLLDAILAPAGAAKEQLELLLSERAREYVAPRYLAPKPEPAAKAPRGLRGLVGAEREVSE